MNPTTPFLTWRIPLIAAVSPWHVGSKRSKGVEEAVGNEHVVVDAGDEGDHEHGPSNTWNIMGTLLVM